MSSRATVIVQGRHKSVSQGITLSLNRSSLMYYIAGFKDSGCRGWKKPVAPPWFLDWVTRGMPFPKTDREEIRFGQEWGDGEMWMGGGD